jgi:NAD(P)H-hydrate epimerase
MRVLTAAEMREADRRAIEELGIPGRLLMENAGRAVVEALLAEHDRVRLGSVAVVCGKGNNGGDGLVVLRQLVMRGVAARAFVLAGFDRLSSDAGANLTTALKLGLEVTPVEDETGWEGAFAWIARADVVVDAIFGTGLVRPAEGLVARAIHDINRVAAFKVAVDIPSGLPSDGGAPAGEHLRADLTVALGAPKVSHLLPPGSLSVGKLLIADIGIPPGVLNQVGGLLETLDPALLKGLLPPRRPDAHKGDFGHLLLVAGSLGKTGAASLAALAALRSGVGLVTVACPRSALPIIARASPDLMTEPLPETPSGTLAAAAAPRLFELLSGKTALALGPGLGRDPETDRAIRQLVGEATVPTLADADALNAFAGSLDQLPRGRALALTPHPGEMARLLGVGSEQIQSDRLTQVRRLASECQVWVALKGFRTLVAEPSGRVRIGMTGNPGLAKGGTGDVLAGMAGAFLAQGHPPALALGLAVHLHGLAGDLVAAETGEVSLLASDLLRRIPEAIRKLQGS